MKQKNREIQSKYYKKSKSRRQNENQNDTKKQANVRVKFNIYFLKLAVYLIEILFHNESVQEWSGPSITRSQTMLKIAVIKTIKLEK